MAWTKPSTNIPDMVTVIFTMAGREDVDKTLNSAQVTALMSTKHVVIAEFESAGTIDKTVWQSDSNGIKLLVHLK